MTFLDWYFTAVVFLFGACWGSFLNVCIFRIPAELSVIRPRSRCPKCKANIKGYDNIPILSWLFLGAKCRHCKTPISARYPSVELLTAILFTWVWIHYSYNPVVAPYWVLIFGLILGSFVDIDEMWLPDRCTIGGMILGPVFSFLLPSLHGAETRLDGLIASLIGLGFGFGLLWLVGFVGKLIFKKDAMGFGDVKLLGALGAFLGFHSVIFIVFMSSLLGSVVGVGLIVLGKKEWQSRIPFGPYIALAALIWMLGGSAWWDAYIEWMTTPY